MARLKLCEFEAKGGGSSSSNASGGRHDARAWQRRWHCLVVARRQQTQVREWAGPNKERPVQAVW
jgi:hypothetical protein